MPRLIGITPAEAFRQYSAMPPDVRSQRALIAQLARRGISVHKRTIHEWSRKGNWVARIREAEERAGFVSTKSREQAEELSRQEAHAELGRLLVDTAHEALVELRAAGHELTPTEIARLGKLGVELERLAAGYRDHPSNITNIYNVVAPQLLAVIASRAAQHIPDEHQRTIFLSDVADDVNTTRDALLFEGAARLGEG